jgi:heat shock protein HtpX
VVWFKRIGLFLIVNVLVMTTISIVTSLLGLRGYLTPYGIDYGQLMAFCLIWGMAGSFISLLLSKVMAKWMMGVQIVDTNVSDPRLRELVNMVHRLSDQAGLPKRPDVGVYESPEVNAFATGPSKSNSLVAVSTGLLNRMNRDEVEGVIGHEVAHIANGDMVTMTLIQGIVNAFVMFFARIIGYAVANALRSNQDDRPSYMIQSMVTLVMDILFSILGSIVVAWFSRWREFRADRGGASLAGRGKMIAALQSLKSLHNIGPDHEPEGQQAIAALKISSRRRGFLALFSTHPDLDDRIAALKAAQFQ